MSDPDLIVETQPRAASYSPNKINDFKSALHQIPVREDAEIEPKILHPFISEPGSPPRRILAERKRREYKSYDIAQLLKERNIDYSDPNFDADRWLPLEPFCDSTYDTRSIEDYIKIAYEPTKNPTSVSPTPEYLHPLTEQREFKKIDAIGLREIAETNSDGSTFMSLSDEGDQSASYQSSPLPTNVATPVVTKKKLRRPAHWQPCKVIGYSPDTEMLQVKWNSDNEISHLSHLSVLFLMEDPVLFADKVANAHKRRHQAESLLIRNFYIDNMPIDENISLSPESEKRILSSLSSLLSPSLSSHLQTLMKQVHLDYQKTINGIAFEKFTSKASNQKMSLLSNLDLEAIHSLLHQKQETPYYGLVPIPKYSFEDVFSSFTFSSFLTRPEVIASLKQVKTSCEQLIVRSPYSPILSLNKPSTLETFRALHHSTCSAMGNWAKDAWLTSICNTITMNLSSIGKGWYNLMETSISVYRYGKLNKLLRCVRLMMEDSLLVMTKHAVENFENDFFSCVPQKIQIKDSCNVENEFALNPKYLPYTSPSPIFTVELVVRKEEAEKKVEKGEKKGEGGEKEDEDGERKGEEKEKAGKKPKMMQVFDIGVTKEQIKELLEDIIDAGVSSTTLIPYPEYIILPHLFRSQTRFSLDSLPADDSIVLNLKQRVGALIDAEFSYLNSYLETISPLQPYCDIVADEETARLKQREPPVTSSDLKALILKRQDDIELIENELPTNIRIGIFDLDCSQVRKELISTLKQSANLLLSLLLSLLRSQTLQVDEKVHQIISTLKAKTNDIEAVSEMLEYIEKIPFLLDALSPLINDAIETYDSLLFFKASIQEEDHISHWRVRSSNKIIHDLIISTTESLRKQKEAFLKNMIEEQKEFVSTNQSLEQSISLLKNSTDLSKLPSILANVQSIKERLVDAMDSSRKYNSRELLFNVPPTDYTHLQGLLKEFEPFDNMWTCIGDWVEKSQQWMSNPLDQINPIEFEEKITNYSKVLFKTIKTLKDKDCLEILKICEQFRQNIDSWKPHIPLVNGLRSEGLSERHWSLISEISSSKMATEINPQMPDFTLENLLSLGISSFANEIAEIGDRASKEYAIERDLANMKAEWEKMAFDVKEPYKATNTYILKGVDVIQNMLDEQIQRTQALCFSPYKKLFEKEIEEWNKDLLRLSDIIEIWTQLQLSWIYLQPIFSSNDIIKQLPVEGKKFRSIDSTWRMIMKNTHDNPNVRSICLQEGMYERLSDCFKNLEEVQKGLSDYLETKRQAFPRFYFLSDDELLEILSQATDPYKVQPYLKKVFEAINKLTFDANAPIAIGMISGENEKVAFVNGVNTKDRLVEVWMTDIEREMKVAVKNILVKAVKDYGGKSRKDWVLSHAGQVVINGSQVHWTREVEVALEKNLMKKYFAFLNEQLLDMVSLVRSPLTKLQSITLGSLIVIDVHAKDVVEKLLQEKVSSVEEFEWISQLRYYYYNNNCYVHCIETVFPYGYEYLGNTGRLVITPLTDKCYMTLLNAHQLHLGGSPIGPAGTGKTETTKDLAKALSMQCVVFNCSDQMDYIMIGKFFKGLSSSGAWVCFDEFNRINIEVLSVIAQQLLVLFNAKKELNSLGNKAYTDVEFEGTNIKLFPTFNVFITMNPGYAGRTELPDNLKSLFRCVSMMVPDYAMIGEIMLYSFGFENARVLAKKKVMTFKLCSEQLSEQNHYDYGMRAVRSVINAAGLLKRKYGTMNEELLLLRALRDVNVPKFLKDDIPLFESIISDLFPDVIKKETNNDELISSIVEGCGVMSLKPTKMFIDKCIQLYDTIQVRHGLMLVGNSGAGKTSTYKVLQWALTNLKKKADQGEGNDSEEYYNVKTHILNPKAIKIGELYGEFDALTHEWVDGILASLMKQSVKDETNDRHWVMFDGPVDALWIENMNTVLDDNKKLCLTSGEVIQLTNYMTMMFEVEDLLVASPATVSRCGMIYIDSNSLDTMSLVDSWFMVLSNVIFSAEFRTQLYKVIKALLPTLLRFLRKNVKEIFATHDLFLTSSFLKILSTFFNSFDATKMAGGKKVLQKALLDDINPYLVDIVVFSLLWSVGATCNDADKGRVSDYLLQVLQENQLQHHCTPEGVADEKVKTGVNFYNYYFDMESRRWLDWYSISSAMTITPSTPYESIVVPTLESIRITYILQELTNNDYNTLLVGNTGTGKSVTINDYLINKATTNNRFMSIFLSFSAQTTANQTQSFVDSKLEKRKRNVYGPPISKRMLFFIDDLNMPKKEEFGSQPPLELLRLFFDHNGWYDTKTLQFKKIEDVTLLSAMGLPGGGRTYISNRVVRHFCLLTYSDVNDTTLYSIFHTLLKNYLVDFSQDIQAVLGSIVQSSITMYNKVITELLPTPNKMHYTFNLRDMWRVFQGLCTLSNKAIHSVLSFIRCWAHETIRVFSDRLIDDSDIQWFHHTLLDTASKNFQTTEKDIFPRERLLFCNIIANDAGTAGTAKLYKEVLDISILRNSIREILDDYNSNPSNKAMNLVLFDDACEHIVRISRILRQPYGNGLLLGRGGAGSQSLSRLSSYINELTVFQIQITALYGVNEWRDDIRNILLACGLKETPYTFLMSDSQIVRETMLEDINNILNSGDLPNLYKPEDLENIYTLMRPICTRQNLTPTKQNLFALFINRIRKNIHIILCMSPLNPSYRSRLRMFPSLINCCTINWFSGWASEALYSVAKQELFNTTNTENEEFNQYILNKESVLECLRAIHLSVEEKSEEYKTELRRYNYVTPTSYLELLNMFKKIVNQKRNEQLTLQARLKGGLDKLYFAKEQISQLKIHITNMQPELEIAEKDVMQQMEQIEKDKNEVKIVREAVFEEEKEAQKKTLETIAMKESADEELNQALPQLKAAVKCVEDLTENQLREIKSLSNPPSGVRLIIEGLAIMMKVPAKKEMGPDGRTKIDNYFEPARKLLFNDPKQLLGALQNYDKDNIPESLIKKIEPYINNPNFVPEVIRASSVVCEALVMWVRAMYKYYFVHKTVEPKMKAQQEAKLELERMEKNLEAARERLSTVDERLRVLEENFSNTLNKRNELINTINDCKLKLERAEKLINGLGGEEKRWLSIMEQIIIDLDYIPMNALVSASSIVYFGSFVIQYREALLHTWRDIIHKHLGNPKHTDMASRPEQQMSLIKFIGDQVKIRNWLSSNLPGDNYSIENVIILENSPRCSLLIDPQLQARRFLKAYSTKFHTGIDVCKASDGNVIRTLETNIQTGKWFLLENINSTIEPVYDNILYKRYSKQAGSNSYAIRLGEKTIPYNENFRFFLATSLPNPHFPPEIQVKILLLNFSITAIGLEEQMMSVVVINEAPELEEKKNFLVLSNIKMKNELKVLEDLILEQLAATNENILSDESLIYTLAASKEKTLEINEKVKETENTEREIDTARELYRPVAFVVSLLFFVINDLSNLDSMYQYALHTFKDLFVNSVASSPPCSSLPERVEMLINRFSYALYQNVSRSLFAKHKLIFSLSLVIKILQGDRLIDADELRFILSGQYVNGEATLSTTSPFAWLDIKIWNEIEILSQIPHFRGLKEYLLQNEAVLYEYYISPDAHLLDLSQFREMNRIQKLCFLRTIRKDKIIQGVNDLIEATLGKKFLDPPPFNLKDSFVDSSPISPLLLIISPGSDPVRDVLEFAEELNMKKKLDIISLGQGQGVKAARLIENATQNGNWVLLQNCHLSISWLSTLEAITESLSIENVHKDFRLWLTSMATPAFPISILQRSVKLTNEPPQGVRANMIRALTTIDDRAFEDCRQPDNYKKLVFNLCFFHSIIQERKRFGALGWNIPYEFTLDDLDVSRKQLQLLLNKNGEKIPFKVLNYLASQINYGGRVTDNSDKRLISSLLELYWNGEVIEKGSDYFFSPSKTYYCPDVKSKGDYINYVMTLPLNTHPELFGLSDNASITLAQEDSELLLTSISLISSQTQIITRDHGSVHDSAEAKEKKGQGEKNEKEEEEEKKETMNEKESIVLNIVDQLVGKLPKEFDVERVKEKYPVTYEESINTVLVQECIRYNNLLRTIRKHLIELEKGIKGLVVMNEELEMISSALYINQLPKQWGAPTGFLSLKNLSNWFNELLERLVFLNRWIEERDIGSCWLSGLFFPQAYLTGVMQNYARRHKIAIDRITFDFVFLDIVNPGDLQERHKVDKGCLVHGMYIEGASWSIKENKLVPATPRLLFDVLPIIHFVPVVDKVKSLENVYECPLYKVVSRRGTLSTTGHSTNFILYMNVRTDIPADVWVRAGVAAFLSLKY